MDKISRDFISEEKRYFRFKLGNVLASSLTGFLAGVIFASIFWGAVLYLYSFEAAL